MCWSIWLVCVKFLHLVVYTSLSTASVHANSCLCYCHKVGWLLALLPKLFPMSLKDTVMGSIWHLHWLEVSHALLSQDWVVLTQRNKKCLHWFIKYSLYFSSLFSFCVDFNYALIQQSLPTSNVANREILTRTVEIKFQILWDFKATSLYFLMKFYQS